MLYASTAESSPFVAASTALRAAPIAASSALDFFEAKDHL
jgi:hypothetical protein